MSLDFENETHRLQHAMLKALVMRHSNGPGVYETGIPGLSISIRDPHSGRHCQSYMPSIGVILNGRKRSVCGERVYEYGEGDCLVTGIDIPSAFELIPPESTVALVLALDKELMGELITKMPLEAQSTEGGQAPVQAVTILATEARMTEAFLRLAELMDRPREIALRAPGLIRDIYCLLLLGDQGHSVRQIYTRGSAFNRISQAITWLRDHFTQPLSVEALAERVHMSTSSFHRHFKDVTSISPLQYHKRLRLYEAQRLLVSEGMDVGSAAYAVGYLSPTQFSREYKTLFGLPPGRDAESRRQMN